MVSMELLDLIWGQADARADVVQSRASRAEGHPLHIGGHDHNINPIAVSPADVHAHAKSDLQGSRGIRGWVRWIAGSPKQGEVKG